MSYRLLRGNVLSFAKHYKGELFHALLCDPPYHLTSIVKRFGKENSAPAKDKDGVYKRASKGFMGKQWDGGDIAFRPETWHEIGKLLYPGAFGMAFGGARTAHRMAVAIEDAGFVIHPMIGWVYGSGFPKATRVKSEDEFEGHRYGAQALKPALEPIVVFQKPYEGRPLDNIVDTGAGTLNIDRGRIGTQDSLGGGALNPEANAVYNIDGFSRPWMKDKEKRQEHSERVKIQVEKAELQGRWPANFLLTHHVDCKMVGYKDSDSYQINRFTDGAKPFGDGAGHEFESEEMAAGKIAIWNCVDDCPVKALDKQSGYGTSKRSIVTSIPGKVYGQGKGLPSHTGEYGQNDFGGASRFFHQSHWQYEQADPFIYQAKVSPSERDAGLSVRCPHPTMKPIALTEYLAGLLLPPDSYSPRRILVPFAGVGSEMIGTFMAGWEYAVGVELENEYAKIGKKRIEHWLSQGKQLSLI